MIFVKPNYFEISFANERKDEFQDEILIYTINESHELIEHAPIDLFFYFRNRAIIYGRSNDGEYVSKNIMSIRTKKQQYAGWDPVLTIADFERMIQKKINMELAKREAYRNEPKKYSFYRDYA